MPNRTDDINDKELFKGEQFFFNESDEADGPKIEFATYDNDGNEVKRTVVDNSEVTSVSLEYLSNVVDDYNDAARAMPNSIHQTAVIYVDDKPLSNISSIRKAQLRRLIDNMNLSEVEREDEMAALNEDEDDVQSYIVKVNIDGFERGYVVPASDEEDAKKAASEMINRRLKNSKFTISSVKKVDGSSKIKSFLDESNDGNIETVDDFVNQLKQSFAKDNDKLMFRIKKEAYSVFDIHCKGGTCVVDLAPAIMNKNGLLEDDIKNVQENWRNGGYGGYGRTYRSYGEIGAPRGKAISWFDVAELDPKARGKMKEWRVGPSNFPFNDLLYPNRKYKIGTTVLRSKFLKAGDESGVKYIAVPSYLDAIKNNDENAIALLDALDIPLDLTFGYTKDEDFSSTYVEK